MSSTTKSRGSAISGDDSIKSGGCVNSVCVDPTGEALTLSIVLSRQKLIRVRLVIVPGRLLVMAGESGQVELHDIRGDRHLQTLHQHSGEVRCVRLCPPATHLMSGEKIRVFLTKFNVIDDNQHLNALEVLQIYFLIFSISC